MSHDAATSQRSERPTLFAMLDVAIAQSGVRGVDSDAMYALTVWSIRQGRRFPWYFKYETNIIESEGGFDQVILTVAGAALGIMQAPGFMDTVDNDKPLAKACYEAGKDWRSGLRRQWGDKARQRDEFVIPTNFSALALDEGETIEDYITEHAVEIAGPSPEFDPRNIQDPRLRRLWATLTDKERASVIALADGANGPQAGELIGIPARTQASRMVRVRAKARAMGAAV